MFIVFLRFGENKSKAPELMAEHNAWIARGFEDGVFLVTGSLGFGQGGCIVAHSTTLIDLEKRIAEDPFVAQHVVSPEIHEITPTKTDERLAFLK